MGNNGSFEERGTSLSSGDEMHGTHLSAIDDMREKSITARDEKRVLHDVERKLRKKSLIRAIPELLLNVGTLYRMLRDSSFHLTWATRGLIIGGLAYFLLPTDATPDYLPVIGFLDDTVVIGLIVKRLASEIDRYKQHAAQRIDMDANLMDVVG